MKTFFLVFTGLLISVNIISQDFEYRKDDRLQNEKEDVYNSYQADRISETTLLKGLEMAGINIFQINILPEFDKEYNFAVYLNEYINNEKVSSKDIAYTYKGKNIYVYYLQDSLETEGYKGYINYIPIIIK